MSTPKEIYKKVNQLHLVTPYIQPCTVPVTDVPFFSSIVTVSWFNFIKNLRMKTKQYMLLSFANKSSVKNANFTNSPY